LKKNCYIVEGLAADSRYKIIATTVAHLTTFLSLGFAPVMNQPIQPRSKDRTPRGQDGRATH
jgi:hypothetical protein